MIKFTLKQNKELSQKPKANRVGTPSRMSMSLIMGYAFALEVQNSIQIGKIDILLN